MFRVFGGVFVASLLPTCMTAVLFLGLVGLGTWQVERLAWKENLLATIAARMALPPLRVGVETDRVALPLKALDYRTAVARGHFVPNSDFTLTAISLKGEGGYEILTPLALDEGELVLIDRGWISYNDRATPDKWGAPQGSVEILGNLRIPQHHWLQPANHPERNEWYGVDIGSMSDARHLSGLKPFILVEAETIDGSSSIAGAVSPIPGQLRVDLPNNHLVYAVIWYGLAITILIIYGLNGWQRTPRLPAPTNNPLPKKRPR